MSGRQREPASERHAGTVHETAGGVYAVELEEGTRIEAHLRGRLKRDARAGSAAVIGDRVVVEPAAGAWAIERVEPRRNQLTRRGQGGRAPRVLAANLDRVFVVVAARRPAATPALVDRLLALASSSDIPPVLVVNKMDLAVGGPGPDGERDASGALDPGSLIALYRGLGYPVVPASVRTGEGIEELRRATEGQVAAFAGPSGVGKSSLLNAMEPGLSLRVGTLSERRGTGRHTTVSGRLIRLANGGLVADTPGFADAALWHVPPEDVARCFPEIAERAADCRFRSCTHRSEPDCAVRAAVEAGEVPPSRYESYRAMLEEAEAERAR